MKYIFTFLASLMICVAVSGQSELGYKGYFQGLDAGITNSAHQPIIYNGNASIANLSGGILMGTGVGNAILGSSNYFTFLGYNGLYEDIVGIEYGQTGVIGTSTGDFVVRGDDNNAGNPALFFQWATGNIYLEADTANGGTLHFIGRMYGDGGGISNIPLTGLTNNSANSGKVLYVTPTGAIDTEISSGVSGVQTNWTNIWTGTNTFTNMVNMTNVNMSGVFTLAPGATFNAPSVYLSVGSISANSGSINGSAIVTASGLAATIGAQVQGSNYLTSSSNITAGQITSPPWITNNPVLTNQIYSTNIVSNGNSTGANNRFMGQNSGNNTMTGSDNTGLGLNTLIGDTTGSDNTAIGFTALINNKTGIDNTAMGSGAMASNTNGSYNISIGFNAMYNTLSSAGNIAIGTSSLINTSGDNNTAIGDNSMTACTTGSYNLGNGFGSFPNLLTGQYNIAFGTGAGVNITNGNYNIDISASGTLDETGIIRIGTTGKQTATYLTGIVYGNGSGITNIPASGVTGKLNLTNIPPIPATNVYGGITNPIVSSFQLPIDSTNIGVNANNQLTVGPGVVTNINVGNVTFQHALTTGSGTGVDVFTVNGKIYQPYGGNDANGNIFNNGAWSDDGSGNITAASFYTTASVQGGSMDFDGDQIFSDGYGNLSVVDVESVSIMNQNSFKSDGGSFYSDGSGNINVQSLTTLGAITNDNGSIHSDGAGTLYASKFNGDGGLETNIVWSRSIWNFNPTPQLSPYYIVMGLTGGTQTSATRALYPTVESEIIPKAGILSLMITIQNGTGAGGAGSNIYIFACSNGVVLSPPALTIPISSLPYLTPITYTATNYTTWAGGTNLLSLILSNNSTTSVTPFSVFGFSGAIQVR